jgi:hypothetical protein
VWLILCGTKQNRKIKKKVLIFFLTFLESPLNFQSNETVLLKIHVFGKTKCLLCRPCSSLSKNAYPTRCPPPPEPRTPNPPDRTWAHKALLPLPYWHLDPYDFFCKQRFHKFEMMTLNAECVHVKTGFYCICRTLTLDWTAAIKKDKRMENKEE